MPTTDELVADLLCDPQQVRHMHALVLEDLAHVLDMRQQDPHPDACRRLLAAVAIRAARQAIAARRAGKPHDRLTHEAEDWLLDLHNIEPRAGWVAA